MSVSLAAPGSHRARARECPPQVHTECWAMMSDREQAAIQGLLNRAWYDDIGRKMSDDDWVRMLMTQGSGLAPAAGKS